MKQKITSCDWEITTKCNLKCKHCIINNHPKELTTKQCKKVIDNLCDKGCKEINLTGGEPLLRKDIFEILEYANKKGIKNRILTNGTLINYKNIGLFKDVVDYIGFSLDGLEKENDYIRGEGSFRKTVNAIKLAKKNKINIGVYITLNKINLPNLNKFLIFVKKLNPLNMVINEIVFRGRAKENERKLYTIINLNRLLKLIQKVFPNQKFTKETGCLVNKTKQFISPEGKMYWCVEIYQTRPNLDVSKIACVKKKKCPYFSISSRNMSINLLNKKRYNSQNKNCLNVLKCQV